MAGNIRELSNLIERLTITHPNQSIDFIDLPDKYKDKESVSINSEIYSTPDVSCSSLESKQNSLEGFNLLPPEGVSLKNKINDIERNFINEALKIEAGVISRAAILLSMKRTTLIEKMRKYGISYNA